MNTGVLSNPHLEVTKPRVQPELGDTCVHQIHLPDDSLWATYHRFDDMFVVRYPGLADFAISGHGGCVTCMPCPSLDQATREHLFINQVRPLALGLQGKSVFHGAAVDIMGAASAFLAESGRGKSTLAAAFARRGYAFLTDDGLLVEPQGTGFVVEPSAPGLRLLPDSAEAVIAAAQAPADSASYAVKRKFTAGLVLPFCPHSRPLRVAYLLGDGTAGDISVERITGAEAAMAWVQHAFLLEFRDKLVLSNHFDRTAALAQEIPLYRLDYPRRFELLDELIDRLAAHSAELEMA